MLGRLYRGDYLKLFKILSDDKKYQGIKAGTLLA
jgi:hypothetical protein